MAKKQKEEEVQVTPQEEMVKAADDETVVLDKETEAEIEEAFNEWKEKYDLERDAHLRLAAEYDNFRKRNTKEKELLYTLGKADAVEKLLPVYDNLERALNQPTADEAYKKGVELTLTELVKIFGTLGVEIYGQAGDIFDPNIHNAVMHVDDENFEENTITQVFQKGFKLGEKIVRFAMVQVAN